MKLVYTHPNLAIVVQAASLLRHAGIDSELRNEYASGAIGEIAPINAWPELWVSRERAVDQALEIVEAMQRPVDCPDWNCGQCESNNPATFDTCWHCGEDISHRATPNG